MSILDNLSGGDIGRQLLLELIGALGLDDSSQGGMFDKTYISGYEYYAGLHLGVCHGPVDYVSELQFKGRPGWVGRAVLNEQTTDQNGFDLPVPKDQENPWAGAPDTRANVIIVNQPDLFGGERVEGGAMGIVHVLHGHRTQEVDNYLDTKLKPAGSQIKTPAYRGILSLVFHNNIKSSKQYIPQEWLSFLSPLLSLNRAAKLSEPVTQHTGFYWGAMNPSLKEVAVRVFRAIQGWNGTEGGTAWYPVGDDGHPRCVVTRWVDEDPKKPRKFMNPVHITVQCLTDLRFGMKLPLDLIGQSFYRCADQLSDQKLWVGEDTLEGGYWEPRTYIDEYGNELPCEGIGLGIVWSGENSIRAFLSDIMRYINGNVYIDHETGKLEMVLVRKVPSESINQLPEILPSQIISVGTFSRPTGEEAVNTISVVYTDYQTEKTETVTRSNTAMVAIYGAVISESLDLPGVKNTKMAAEICEREVQMKCALPGVYTRMQVTKGVNPNGRSDTGQAAFTLYEGAPFLLTYPKHNIERQVFRVSNINFGDMTSNYVEFDAVEDVFGLVDSAFIEGIPEPDWSDPFGPIREFISDEVRIFPVPYTLLLGAGGTALINALNPRAGLVVALANTDDPVTTGHSLYTNSNGGDPDYYSQTDPALLIGSATLCPTSVLLTALPIVDSNGDIVHSVQLDPDFMSRVSEETVEGAWGLIGNEKFRCVSIDKDENSPSYLTMTIERGIYDSIPEAHEAGAKVWWFNNAASSAAWSALSRYDEGEGFTAYDMPYGITGGLHLSPETYRVNMVADNAWFAPYPPANVKINGEYYPDSIVAGDLTIEWACRNRVSQSDVAVPWDSPGVDPEVGTTYNLRIYDVLDDPEVDTPLHEELGIDTYGATGYYTYTGGAGPGQGYIIHLEAIRDGKASTAAYTHTIADVFGYGLGYGFNYGSLGVRLNFGDPAPVVQPPLPTSVCPRPAWISEGNWASFDATVQADGGKGYPSPPSILYDYYHDSGSPEMAVNPSGVGAKPYNHRLQCTTGSGAASEAFVSDGSTIWRREIQLPADWIQVPKPSAGLFSTQAIVDSLTYRASEFVICMNKGADIYTATPSGLPVGTYTRKGVALEANDLSMIMQAEWIKKIEATNYIACGKYIGDSGKVAVARSTDLTAWTLETTEAPKAALDSRNWVFFNGAYRIFSTVGDKNTGSVYCYSTTDGFNFTARSMGAPPHTPVVGRGFAFATSPSTDVIQVFAGAYLFTSNDALTWTSVRAKYAPEQLLAAMASPEPFVQSWPGGTGLPAALESKGLLFRSGRFMYQPDAPEGHPGRVFKGALLCLDGGANDNYSFAGNQPSVIQPTAMPYGNRVGGLGDISTGISDAGFDSAATRDDVYGFIGAHTSGKKYFEIHIGSDGLIIAGVAAALGPEEVAPVSSAILMPSKVYTSVRLKCPGGLSGLNTSMNVSHSSLANVVLGVQLDLDALTCKLTLDGEDLTTISGLTTGLVWFPVFTSSSVALKLNLGQRPFETLPPGFSAWLS